MQVQADTMPRRAEDFATGIKERAEHLKKDYLDRPLDQASGYIRENPVKTMLMAVGLGVVIGSLLRRR